MKIINVTYMLMLILCIFHLVKIKSKRVVKIGTLKGTCDGYPQNLTRFTDIKIVNVDGVYNISLKLVNLYDTNHDIKVQIIPYKCKSNEQLDTCEKTTNITMKHFCGLLNSELKPWTPFIQAMEPPLKCPFKKGTYVMTNGTVDLRELALWPMGSMYWRAKVISRDEVTNEFLSCIYVEGQFIR